MHFYVFVTLAFVDLCASDNALVSIAPTNSPLKVRSML